MSNYLGIIGGSGLYEMEGLTDIESRKVLTPFGDPSDEILTGILGDTRGTARGTESCLPRSITAPTSLP
jgi:purine nucleoside phosphorylase